MKRGREAILIPLGRQRAGWCRVRGCEPCRGACGDGASGYRRADRGTDAFGGSPDHVDRHGGHLCPDGSPVEVLTPVRSLDGRQGAR